MSYLDWGGSSAKPQIAIVDWGDVPTVSEFEILQERFERMGIPTLIADPRELEWDGKSLAARDIKIDLVYRPRAHQRHRGQARGVFPRWSKRIRRMPCAWRITSAARFRM